MGNLETESPPSDHSHYPTGMRSRSELVGDGKYGKGGLGKERITPGGPLILLIHLLFTQSDRVEEQKRDGESL